ncbi:MAG: hypothetical protein ABIX12_00910 [Rubrivivax sp.]
MAVGEALNRAKLDYLVSTPDLRGLHQKAVLEATVFGLPMLGVDLPAGRIPLPTPGASVTPNAVTSGPAATLGLKTQSIRVAPTLTPESLMLTNVTGGPAVSAHWFRGPDGVVVNPAVPALPLVKVNATSTDTSVVLRGVGFRGGHYTDAAGIVPLTGAATADLRGVHVPFGSSTFFPMKFATANYFGSLAGSGGTSLLVTPAQYRADNVLLGTSVERKFDNLDFKLYYSGIAPSPDNRSVALSDAPTIVQVDARTAVANGPVTFVTQVVGDPAAAIHEVWVTYTRATGTGGADADWTSLDLQQCAVGVTGLLPAGCSGVADSSLWTAQLANPGDIEYVVQAASGTGLVSLNDNLGHYFRVNGGTPPATTSAAFTATPPSAANFGETPTVSLALKSGNAPLANRLVTVSIGGNAAVGVTDSSGNVTVGIAVVTIPGTYELKANFAGDATHAPTELSAPLTVGKAPTSLVATSNGVTLTANLGGKTQPLIQETVIFDVTGSNGVTTIYAATDYLGRALLPPPGLPPGTYTVGNARFAGNATYQAAALVTSGQFNIPQSTQTLTFAPLPAVALGAPDFIVTANSSSGLPETFAVSGQCTLIGLSTVHVTGAGNCVVTASQAGNAYYSAAPSATQSFAIGGRALSVSAVVSPATLTYGDDRSGGTAVRYQYAFAGDALCIPSPVPTTFAGPASPLAAGSYSIVPPALTLPQGCTATYNSATLTVAKAPAAFSGIAGVITVAPNQAFSVGGMLNRADRADVYPQGADAATFSVVLNRSVGQHQMLMPTAPANPNGNFTVAGPALPVGAYGLEFIYEGGPNFTDAADVYPTLRVEGFAGTTPMTQARSDHTATLLNDGRVLVLAGRDATGAASATAEVYCPTSLTLPANKPQAKAMCPAGLGAFGAMSKLQGKSAGHTATLMPSGRVFVVGGGNASTEIFDPATNQFSHVGGAGGSRAYHTATLLPNGLVLLVGGSDQYANTLATTQLYDPRNGVYTLGPTLLWPRERHSATLVQDNGQARVIIAGGRQRTATGSNVLANVEVYDVATQTISAAAPMAGARYSHRAEVLADGRVLVSGGSAEPSATPTGALDSAELYGNGIWTSVMPSMHDARREHTLTTLVDGRLLASGGAGSTSALASSETFTPDHFMISAPLAMRRFAHTATRLQDGKVLITGGVGANGAALNSAEIFSAP